MLSSSSGNVSSETVNTDDYKSEYIGTIYTYLKIMNKRIDEEFSTSEFLLNTTIQSCCIYVIWNKTEVSFSLVSKYDKDSYCIKPSFIDIKIFYETNQINFDFKVHEINNYYGYCNMLNNLDFYDYRQLKFQFYIKHLMNTCESLLPKKCELYTSLKNMYREKKFADLRIFIKNTEFLAHKAIVGRNSTFAEMFENSTEENNVKIIDIKDLNPDLFEILLNYLYVGEIEKIDFTQEKLSFLFDLIQAADKYKIDDMKIKLIEKTIIHLNKDNIIDILLFAVRCNLDELKNQCIYYITVYRTEISETVLFKNMIFQNPKITGSILLYVLQTIGI